MKRTLDIHKTTEEDLEAIKRVTEGPTPTDCRLKPEHKDTGTCHPFTSKMPVTSAER
jgi:hypothetical protein